MSSTALRRSLVIHGGTMTLQHVSHQSKVLAKRQSADGTREAIESLVDFFFVPSSRLRTSKHPSTQLALQLASVEVEVTSTAARRLNKIRQHLQDNGIAAELAATLLPIIQNWNRFWYEAQMSFVVTCHILKHKGHSDTKFLVKDFLYKEYVTIHYTRTELWKFTHENFKPPIACKLVHILLLACKSF